jgi:hypothetical protein
LIKKLDINEQNIENYDYIFYSKKKYKYLAKYQVSFIVNTRQNFGYITQPEIKNINDETQIDFTLNPHLHPDNLLKHIQKYAETNPTKSYVSKAKNTYNNFFGKKTIDYTYEFKNSQSLPKQNNGSLNPPSLPINIDVQNKQNLSLNEQILEERKNFL